MREYIVRAKIVSVLGTTNGQYNVVYQRCDSIDDTTNPFYGQKKMAVSTVNKMDIGQLALMWKCPTIIKLINKQVILKMNDDGSIFEKVIGIKKDMTFGFRTQSQQLPKFVVNASNGVEALGEMYK